MMVQIRKVKPHVLLGLSGVGGVFSEEVDSQFLESSTYVFHHLGLFMCLVRFMHLRLSTCLWNLQLRCSPRDHLVDLYLTKWSEKW